MKRCLLLVAALLIVACGHQPGADEKAKASETVGVVLEVDGIRVYRFTDGGRYHYFAVPRNGSFASTFADWQECHPCGKGCTTCVDVNDDVPTLARR